ncbi:MAG: hypothetical protein AABM29_08585 [Actinomycetota bacterium]
MPEQALHRLATTLRGEDTVISPHVADPTSEPALGALAAAGPRATGAPADYSLVIESVREGYLLHYGEARILAGHDADLALLAGDYLYALGLERLASLGDDQAVRELSDLISLSAACHAEDAEEVVSALWLAATVAIGCGPGEGHESAKSATRALAPGAPQALLDAARDRASVTGVTDDLERAAQAIDLPVQTG